MLSLPRNRIYETAGGQNGDDSCFFGMANAFNDNSLD